MRKTILAILLVLLGAVCASAQSTTVTSTVTDTGGVAWVGGTYEFDFVGSTIVTWPSGTVPRIVKGALDGTGSFSQSLPDNNTISPSPSFWTLKVCPISGVQQSCFVMPNITITGANQALTVTPPALAILGSSSLPVAAYADAEIVAPVPLGFIYFQVASSTAGTYRQCVGLTGTACTTWGALSGGGSPSTGNADDVQLADGAGGFIAAQSIDPSESFSYFHALRAIARTSGGQHILAAGPGSNNVITIDGNAIGLSATDAGGAQIIGITATNNVSIISNTAQIVLTSTNLNTTGGSNQQLNIGHTGAGGVLGLVGGTSGIATITAPAVAGTTSNPFVFSNAVSAPGSTNTGTATFSGPGAASTPSVTFTGTVFTGGSGTTTFPNVYLNYGAAPSTWQTTGTLLGMNAPSGFGGWFLDMHVNGGGSVFGVSASGAVANGGAISAGGNVQVPAANIFNWTASTRIGAVANGRINFNNAANTSNGMTRISFGTEAAANPAFCFDGSTATILTCDGAGTTANGIFSTAFATHTGAGAASVSPVLLNGTLFTGGTGTTTLPYFYINQGVAPSGWATTGTLIGMNAPSGFTGNFFNTFVNGVGAGFSVTANGSVGATTLVLATGLNFSHVLVSITAPTIAGAGCGGSAASISTSNSTASFNINVGTAPTAGGCTVTMPAAATGWNCAVNDFTTISTSVSMQKQTASSTTSVTFVNYSDVTVATAPTANDIYHVACTAN